MSKVKNWLLLIRGYWRYCLGLCPACRGELPAERYCLICADYKNYQGPVDAITRLAWWRRYKDFTLGRSKLKKSEVELKPSGVKIHTGNVVDPQQKE